MMMKGWRARNGSQRVGRVFFGCIPGGVGAQMGTDHGRWEMGSCFLITNCFACYGFMKDILY